MPSPELEALTAAAHVAETDPAAAIDSLPWLADAIASDGELFAQWGRSTVIDENTGGAVLGTALFAHLHERAGLSATWPVGNAGLLHTYGYLLSLASTPYGLKRDRWITPDLARAYGLPDDAFTPWTAGTTLLARITPRVALALESDPITIAVDDTTTQIGVVSSAGSTAVAYSVGGQYVTTFPMRLSPDEVRAQVLSEPARLRWNAV